MLRIYECVANEHDLRLLVLSLLLCFFSASTAAIMVQRATAAGTRNQLTWLFAAGLVTGIGIWTNHFSAMLAFAPGTAIHFEPLYMALALAFAVVVSIAGWIIGFGGKRNRPLLGGALIGVALTGSHYFDVFGLRFAGHLGMDLDLVVVSVVVGISLCAFAGHLLERPKLPGLPIFASGALALGIIGLHLIAMAALNLVADPTVEIPSTVFSLDVVVGWVFASTLGILAAGFALGIHDQYRAAITASDRKRLSDALVALKLSEEHYRSALELNPQILWTADQNGLVLEIGPKWSDYVGSATETAHGTGWLAAIHPDDSAHLKILWDRAIATGTDYDARYRIHCVDGSYRWFRDRGQPKRNADGAIVKWYGSLEDIDDQVSAEDALRESEERYRLACGATNDLIWDWHHDTDSVHWGAAIHSHFGYHDATDGTSLGWWSDRVHPDDRSRVLESLHAAIAGTDRRWTHEYRFLGADGHYAHILSRGYIVRDSAGKAVRSIGAMQDISDQKQTELSLRHAAQHDSLTELPNRSLFHERLTAALNEAARNGTRVGLVSLDVDSFKVFNDTRGHTAGDRLLCWIARQLSSAQQDGMTVARLGGDEFAIIVPDYGEDQWQLILRVLQEPFNYEGEAIEISVSAGLGVWPVDASDAEGLIKSADLALYACKADAQNSIIRFKPEMRARANNRAAMLEIARSALREERIWAHYQPKVCLKTGLLHGMEALLRWTDPLTGEHQSPARIAAAFENTELAIRITDRILDCVLADITHWLGLGLPFGRIAVNASAADFKREDFSSRLLAKLMAANVPPTCLELEVTENVLIGRDSERVWQMLQELSRAGMTIALDDFGTGFASLSHLNTFPVDVLKIDQSFVRRLLHDKKASDAIVRAIIGLAKALGIQTVAEGVELQEQLAKLQDLECDLAQGYLFSRPVSFDRVTQMFTDGVLHWPSMVQRNSVFGLALDQVHTGMRAGGNARQSAVTSGL